MSVGSRFLTKYGSTVQVINYSGGGRDSYGDSTLTASTVTTTAIYDNRRNIRLDKGISGAIPTQTGIFTMLDSVDIYDGGTRITASEILGEGMKFKVINVDKLTAGLGMREIQAERMDK